MNKNNNNTQCNNCSKIGHLFHQCKLPIISYGIILFKSSPNGLQYLMIRRKDSFGYIDFIRGKYSCHNIPQIQKSIDEMSTVEKDKLTTEPFDKLNLGALFAAKNDCSNNVFNRIILINIVKL